MQTVHFDDSVEVQDRGECLCVRIQFVVLPVYVYVVTILGFSLKPDFRNLGAVTHALIGMVTPGSLAYRRGEPSISQISQYTTNKHLNRFERRG